MMDFEFFPLDALISGKTAGSSHRTTVTNNSTFIFLIF